MELAWWHLPVIPTLGCWRRSESKSSMNKRYCLKEQKL